MEKLKIPEEIKEIFNEDQSIAFATATKKGIPNINMIGMKKIQDDETILLADNYFAKTLANLKENNEAAILTKRIEEKKWYQIKGTCQYIDEGPEYDEFKRWVKSKKETLPAKGMVIFKVKQIYYTTSGPNAGKPIA